MTAHATLPPSSAHRWRRCTASVGFIEANRSVLPPESTVYADEGTEAHALASAILTGSPLPPARDAEMQINVDAYVAWVRAWHARATKQTLWVERRVELFYSPGQRGTTDATVWGKSFIFVGDLKYGVGVSVEAEKNDQLAIYAESVIREIEEVMDVRSDMPVHLGIFQPRDRNNPEPERLWTLTRSQLADFCAHIEFAAVVILDGKAMEIDGERPKLTFVADPDKQCRFCPAKGICKEYARYGLSVVTDDVDKLPVISLPSPNALTREQRQKVIAAKKPLRDWLDAVEEQETMELLNGAEPMQFKLVTGKANRQWADEKAVAQLLSNHLAKVEIFPPGEILSPAQAEKALKGKELSARFNNSLEKLITRPEGRPTLVPIADKRPALQINKAEGLTKVETLDDV